MVLSTNDIVKILKSRNLNTDYSSLSDIPHFSIMKDMTKGAKRVALAIQNGETVKLCADYDCDGVNACVQIVSFFNDIGYPIDWIIPDRFTDGYGVSEKIIERIGPTDVLLTVDNGINAIQAAKECKYRNIDLIITDHHTPGPILPDCYAIINPKQVECEYPIEDISGCFVAWLFCSAIKHELNLDINMGQYLDLVALSTISDVMPLKGINYHVVRYGLKRINTMQRPFFKELAISLNKNSFSYEDLGFQVSPRINAAGRLKHASLAVEALLANKDEAWHRVQLLTETNQHRKTMQSEMIDNVMDLIGNQKDFVVVHLDSLHEGIAGIVAAKVAETTGYPTIILTTAEDGLLKGSGRTVGVVDIFELVNQNNSYLERFGGHSGACGLALKVENLDAFIKGLRDSSKELPREAFEPLDGAIGELNPINVNLDLYYKIEQFAPFGEGNPTPIFHCKEATVVSSKAVGKEGDHARLTLNWEGKEVIIMAFNSNANEYRKGSKVTFNYRLDLNEWNGNINLQFMPTNEVKVKT
jgi:single-stranded-DNA-specific exonuclease